MRLNGNMKNRLLTISFREIKKSYKRFLSLLIMSFLGVAVFVGLRSTPGTMLKSLDKYYDEVNHYDIRIYSTLGLTEDDVESLNKLNVSSYGIHSKDVITNFKNDTKVIKLIGLNNNINKIILYDGQYPKNNNEIVVEKNLLLNEKLKIGDYIIIDNDDELKNNKFKIVGVIISPLYMFSGGSTVSRGNTNIGTGKIDYYSYVSDSVFNMDYYTEIDMAINNCYLTSSKDYIDLINKNLDSIESIRDDREQSRYNEIINKYNIEINEKEEEGRVKLEKAEDELNFYKNELDNGYLKLLSSKNQLDDSKYQLDEMINTLNSSSVILDEKTILLENNKNELYNSENELKELLGTYGLDIDDIITIKDILNDNIVSIDRLKHIFSNSKYKDDIYKLIDNFYDNDFLVNLDDYINTKTIESKNKLINSIPSDIENYDEIVNDIESFSKDILREDIYSSILDSAYNIDDIKKYIPDDFIYRDKLINLLDNYSDTIIKLNNLFDAVDKLEYGKEEINKNSILLTESRRQLDDGYELYYSYLNEYNNGLNQYYIGYNDYKNSLNLYNSNLEEYLKNKLDFQKQINEAREKLSEIERPKWYIYDRWDDTEYSGYINNTDSLLNLSKAFPTVFFLVSIFMCIMSMSRMAMEDRSEIGTLKSLGFSNKHIILKYMIYSVLATILGSILGGIFGFYFLTWFIYKMYGILYLIPYFAYQYNISSLIVGTFISVVCISGTALITVRKIVSEKPSVLLRPPTHNKGRKILLEYLPFWEKINFSNKITIRNIFRYKKRVIMTILGIAGCSVLLLTGYGIKDSIIQVADKQYGEVFIYDDLIYLDHEVNNIDFIINNSLVRNYEKVYIQSVNVEDISSNLYVIDNNLNYDVININDYKTHERLKLENDKVIITEKLSSLYNYNIGDKIQLIDTNKNKYEFEINGIATNYVGSYVYMNIDTYEKYFDNYIPNIVLINLDDIKYEDSISRELINNEHVLSIVTKTSSLKNIDTMLKSLNYVVLVLIVLSGMLSFVVLYNLSYINISERKREIATLKVLGFTHLEVDNYIIKENFIITIIGIIIGLFISKPFVDYIVNTVEIDLVKFIHTINISSYIYTFLFMILFTSIVTIIIHFTLKKINMIESLKVVE